MSFIVKVPTTEEIPDGFRHVGWLGTTQTAAMPVLIHTAEATADPGHPGLATVDYPAMNKYDGNVKITWQPVFVASQQ